MTSPGDQGCPWPHRRGVRPTSQAGHSLGRRVCPIGPACAGGRRTWAIEGSRGIGRHLASRLVAEGEQVLDVPPKLSARTRVFTAGQGRKTDATDAHSVALAATRMRGPASGHR